MSFTSAESGPSNLPGTCGGKQFNLLNLSLFALLILLHGPDEARWYVFSQREICQDSVHPGLGNVPQHFFCLPLCIYMSAEAVAPVIISTSSPVMTACRVRLNRIWYLLIISPAFLEAFCGTGQHHVQKTNANAPCHLRPWRFGGQTARKRDPQRDPSRWRWRERTPAGWAGVPRRSRKQRSFLELASARNKHCF